MFNRKLALAASALAILLGTAAYSDKKQLPDAVEPPSISVSELNPKLDGKEVTMAFEVRGTYLITGSVPVGVFPSFGITPALAKGAPSLSVLVSGDLANLMDRFGMMVPSDGPVKGRVIQATGKITMFPAQKDAADRRPSYQFSIRDWKRFRMLPAQK